MDDNARMLSTPLVPGVIHRPLKGGTSYFDLASGEADKIAWSCTRRLPFAAALDPEATVCGTSQMRLT